ncbi:hypothetical protein [Streptomyces sp. NPDC057702]|uniref:hypothetical protein n=1 Tax=unclassified Streptomyces TaxID=2593676 RepID=UPI003678EC16
MIRTRNSVRRGHGVAHRAWGGALAVLVAWLGLVAAGPSQAAPPGQAAGHPRATASGQAAGAWHAGGPAPVAGACEPDTRAQGVPSSPHPSSLLAVERADGRVEEFQYFTDATADSPFPFVWHRTQAEPEGAYGPWRRVSAVPVGPKTPTRVSAAEGVDGRIEVFFSSYGVQCHTAQETVDGTWSAPEEFGLNPPPYWGSVALFADRTGRLHAFASTDAADSSMNTRVQDASGGWGPVESMGRVPAPFVGLSQPSTVTQLDDGRLRVVAHEWNADSLFWQITQVSADGPWGPWQAVPAPVAPGAGRGPHLADQRG